jgi:hypothetical protein
MIDEDFMGGRKYKLCLVSTDLGVVCKEDDW